MRGWPRVPRSRRNDLKELDAGHVDSPGSRRFLVAVEVAGSLFCVALQARSEQRLDGRLQREREANEFVRRDPLLAVERAAQDRLGRIKVFLDANPQYKTDKIKARVRRLSGVLEWQINSEYDQRLTDAYRHLHELDEYIEKLNKVYQSFIRTRQAATQSYEGYEIPIRRLRTQIQAKQLKLNGLMARQGRMLETFAINELEKRRGRLEEYQIKARFALAESYDRATKKQQEEMLEQ